jgi:surfeit locus 1 family protein
MRFGAFDFRPTPVPTIVTLLLLMLMTGLGFWQLERAAWKQALVDTHAGRSRLPPIALRPGAKLSDEAQYRRVFARGYYDMEHQLLLDNRTYQGRAGYHVLTPLHLAESDAVVLVNRGWVPLGNSRAELPDIPGTDGEVLVDGIVMLPPVKLFKLAEVDEANTGWPKVVQQIEMGKLEQLLGVKLEPLTLLLDKNDEFGFVREWKAVYGVTVDKHRAYAAQWFTLAVVLLVIYISVNTRRVSSEK